MTTNQALAPRNHNLKAKQNLRKSLGKKRRRKAAYQSSGAVYLAIAPVSRIILTYIALGPRHHGYMHKTLSNGCAHPCANHWLGSSLVLCLYG